MSDKHPIEDYPLVKCRRCGGTFHRVNDDFDPDKVCNGAMLTILPRWKNLGTFRQTKDAIWDRLTCPRCGNRYGDKYGKVLLTGPLPGGGVIVEEKAENLEAPASVPIPEEKIEIEQPDPEPEAAAEEKWTPLEVTEAPPAKEEAKPEPELAPPAPEPEKAPDPPVPRRKRGRPPKKNKGRK